MTLMFLATYADTQSPTYGSDWTDARSRFCRVRGLAFHDPAVTVWLPIPKRDRRAPRIR